MTLDHFKDRIQDKADQLCMDRYPDKDYYDLPFSQQIDLWLEAEILVNEDNTERFDRRRDFLREQGL